MTDKEKARAYDEALEKARKKYQEIPVDYLEFIFPQLTESEDERIRKWILEKVQGYADSGIPCPDEIQMANKALSWLEEQKDKNCLACDQHLKGYIAGRKVTEEEKQKEQKPHYTKRNAPFDKCVENCDSKTVEEVNKRVDDIMNMSEFSAFEQTLTNFIGDWENDEEHWPSQFVKKHGKHVLDMAREELKKEQKPVDDKAFEEWIDDWYQGSKEAGGDIVMSEAEFKNWSRGIRNMYQQKPAEWSEEDTEMYINVASSLRGYACGLENEEHKRHIQKELDWLESRFKSLRHQPKVEWSEEDIKKIRSEEYTKGFNDAAFGGKLKEWSEEDEKKLDGIINTLDRLGYAEFCKSSREEDIEEERIYYEEIQCLKKLKSLRPSWKPSEDDIKMLEHIIGQYETGNKNSKVMGYLPKIEELNFLKKVLAKWKNLL